MNPTTQEQVLDYSFDSLPDDIVLSIFNKLQDAKSLCLTMSVCKRFHSIAPQVAQIFLPIPHKNRKSEQQQNQKGFFKNVLIKTLFKPFQFISQMIKLKSKNDSEDDKDSSFQSFHIPIEVLKSFQEIRGLHLRLPCYGTQNMSSKSEKNNTFLKWKAEFGKELHSCVMIGSKSLSEKLENTEKSRPELRVITDDELKLRIVWTISCLIAASARHYLIQETVKEEKLIENVVVSDESEQGMLCMNKEQIQELKGKGNNEDSILLEYRSKVPALRMKMWFLEKLELEDSGKVMEGATLVVIRPAGGGGGGGVVEDADLVARAFCGEGDQGKVVVEEAVRKLMAAKKCYTLEMNSF